MPQKISKPARNAAKPILRKEGSRVSQTDVPAFSLDKALAIPRAIMDNYAGKTATPLQVAKALNVSPDTGPFRMLCGASIAYGLTKGGYNAQEIALEPLAKKILKPTREGDDKVGKIEAFLKPRIISEFFTKYNGSAIPREDITKNVLEELGVPSDRIDNTFEFVVGQGESLGIITELKGKKYIELNGLGASVPASKVNGVMEDEVEMDAGDERVPPAFPALQDGPAKDKSRDERLKKVFITHGKNTKFIDPIKKLLSFGELQAVVSVEKTTVSQPVPDKVMNDMRSCGSAIIHVEDEQVLMDNKGIQHSIINSNVLIEIGAAMALFGRRFILLVKDGVKLPSNLQGLFEVRYSGDELDGTATIRLMESINDIKNASLPG